MRREEPATSEEFADGSGPHCKASSGYRARHIAIETAVVDAKDLKGDCARATVAILYITLLPPERLTAEGGPVNVVGDAIHEAKTCKFVVVGSRGILYRPQAGLLPDKNLIAVRGGISGLKWTKAKTLRHWRATCHGLMCCLVDQPFCFELDTGATVTVMSEQKFRQCFPDPALYSSTLCLKYTGEAMNIIGQSMFDVSYADQDSMTHTLAIVSGKEPPLLCRNLLQHFVLDWSKMKSVRLASDALCQMLNGYADVFQDGLGTITPFMAQLAVSPSAIPRFFHPCPLSLALRSLVEFEVDCQEY